MILFVFSFILLSGFLGTVIGYNLSHENYGEAITYLLLWFVAYAGYLVIVL